MSSFFTFEASGNVIIRRSLDRKNSLGLTQSRKDARDFLVFKL
jgi:hypothetical protein